MKSNTNNPEAGRPSDGAGLNIDSAAADAAATKLKTEIDGLRKAIEAAVKSLPAGASLRMACGTLSVSVQTHFVGRRGAPVALNEPRRRVFWRPVRLLNIPAHPPYIVRTISGYDHYEAAPTQDLLLIAAELPSALAQYAVDAAKDAEKFADAAKNLKKSIPQG